MSNSLMIAVTRCSWAWIGFSVLLMHIVSASPLRSQESANDASVSDFFVARIPNVQVGSDRGDLFLRYSVTPDGGLEALAGALTRPFSGGECNAYVDGDRICRCAGGPLIGCTGRSGPFDLEETLVEFGEDQIKLLESRVELLPQSAREAVEGSGFGFNLLIDGEQPTVAAPDGTLRPLEFLVLPRASDVKE